MASDSHVPISWAQNPSRSIFGLRKLPTGFWYLIMAGHGGKPENHGSDKELMNRMCTRWLFAKEASLPVGTREAG
jgi:hypothetical protein